MVNTGITYEVDGFVVDRLTGEILGHGDPSSVYAQRADYKRSLADCCSIDDFDEHLKHVDLRKLPPRKLNRLRELESEAYFAWKDSKGAIDCRITAPAMKTLKVLEKAVKYRNILAITQVDLAKMLGVHVDDLMRKLKPLRDRDFVRVRTARNGVRKGEVILTVNPRFVFRGEDWVQGKYAKQWYLDVIKSHPDGIGHSTNIEVKSNIRASYTAEQLEFRLQGRYVEYGESVRAMRLAKMEPLQLAA